MIFGVLNPEKIWHENLTFCPPRLSDVAIVPWEIQKSHFQQYYSYILLIVYVISQDSGCKPAAEEGPISCNGPGWGMDYLKAKVTAGWSLVSRAWADRPSPLRGKQYIMTQILTSSFAKNIMHAT